MDLREQLRIRETAKIKIAARKFDERRALAERAVLDAKISGASKEDIAPLDMEIGNIELEREMFLWEHDTTGAIKGDRFGADAVSRLKNVLARGQDKAWAGLERTHMVLINLSELDRLNDSGDHELGDKALELALEKIQARVEAALAEEFPDLADDPEALAAKYEIYRSSGTDFSVLIKDAARAVPDKVVRVMSGQKLDVTDLRAGEDPASLTANSLSFAEVAKAMGKAEERAAFGEQDYSRFVTVLKEKAQTVGDFEKIRTRFGRLCEKIGTPGESRISPRELYDKYYKRSLGKLLAGGETPLDFEEVVKVLESKGALDGEGPAWQKDLFEIARDEAINQFRSRNLRERQNSQAILESVLKDLGQVAAEIGVESPSEARAETSSAVAEYGEAQEKRRAEFDERTAFLGRTDGERILADLTAKVESDFGPGDLGAAEKRRAKLELRLERAKRDALTGLPLRGVFFRSLETQLSAGKPASVVAIDMAFLKYFDKEGGNETGDTAIKTAARILDYVKRTVKDKHGVEIEACRVGGDEFALYVGSEEKEIMADILRLIRSGQDKSGKIPVYPGALVTYQPEALQFNLGTCGAESPEEFRQRLEAANIKVPEGLAPQEQVRFLADSLSRIADSLVAAKKIIERFSFLLTRSLGVVRAPESEKAARQLNLKTLMAYSEKAIFGDAGKQKIGQWIPRLLEGNVKIKDLVGQEIIPFVIQELKKKGKEEFSNDEEADRILEIELRLSLSEAYIHDLEGRLDQAMREKGEEHEHVRRLKKTLADTRDEFNEALNLKRKIADSG